MLEIGTVVDGKYKILNEIGHGGMSVVYLAVNERANKPWAIKEVRKDGVDNFEVIKQSQIVETNMLKKFNHPNLPSIIDVIDQTDSFLIVMDYIEGKPLSEKLEEQGALPCEDVVEWAKQLCDVLGYLHSRKPPVIYRDMKPSNVMLKPDGSVMLIDFGTAREFKEKNVEDTTCLGTQGYAAPEQFGGQGQTDARTDIYCLGATIYHLVTGHNPSEPPYEMYPIRQWNPALSSGLEKIIIKCTQRNPNDRYQSCAELLYALEHYKEEEEEYKKLQNIKWYLFLTSAVLTLFMGALTLGCHVMISKKTKSTYDEYINTALLAVSAEEKIKYYEDAIQLSPQREEAYIELLETMGQDGIFTEEESQIIRRIMPQYIGKLETEQEAYIKIAYELGMMYFYYYENSEDMQNAARWLDIAIGNTMEGITEEQINMILSQKKAFRARQLHSIVQYYQDLNVTNKEGDAEGSYFQLWEDLSSVVTADIAKEDNNVTALVMYNFMANQLIVHAQDYMEAGVSQDAMADMLNMMDLCGRYDEKNDYQRELYDKLRNNLQQAKKAVELAFSTVD
ncbi:MAG: serine/threonine protein kinase [Bacteroidales bacterium]|nr:serine/threonine protein kinase [Clostridium sp.]MCM1204250.1 serine/threonine protein kinase [Bacteroidales bacterium]